MEKDKAAPSGESASLKFWLVIIPVLGTILVALLNFPPFQKLFEPRPTATSTATIELTSAATSMFTIEPTFTGDVPAPSETFTALPPTQTLATTLTPLPQLPVGMHVVLTANMTSGKAPLKVKLDARPSYFRDASGAVFPCGACEYTWQIRQGSEIIYGPEKGDGTFEFTFGAKGTYFLSVFVCRSNSVTDCGGSGSIIEVR